ncbi:MAG TPA: single-stranded DNA-binding protein, partial [Bacteroidales bacterium]|nr:single-stranded DNA-binding protein [Bacteroidales bacterium]
SLATSERGYTTQTGTQVPERTEWHNLVFWRGLAETVEKYVRKGDKLYIEGSIRNRSYDDQNGVRRYVTEIFVDNMEMLGSRSSQKTTSSDNMSSAQDQEQPKQQVASVDSAVNDDLPF